MRTPLKICWVSLALLALAGCERKKPALANLHWTLVAGNTTKASMGWPAAVTDVWFIQTPGTITLTFPDTTVTSIPFQDISVMSNGHNVRQLIINLENSEPEDAYKLALNIAASLSIRDTAPLTKWYTRRNEQGGISPTSQSTCGDVMADKTARTVGIGRSFSRAKELVYVRVTINVDASDYEHYRLGQIKNRRANGENISDDYGK